MTRALPEYELFAIRYATREARRADHFIGGDPHDGPMPMDYFVWVAKSAERAFVIDSASPRRPPRSASARFLRDPIDALKLVGVDADTVQDVILTHLHYDHVGGLRPLPEGEIPSAGAGDPLRDRPLHAVPRGSRIPSRWRTSSAWCGSTSRTRVLFHNGGAELAPGITLHPVGGHSVGLQFVQVHTKRGWVVVASDTTHFYENMMTGRPFTTAFHIGLMLEAYDTLRAEAPSRSTSCPATTPR